MLFELAGGAGGITWVVWGRREGEPSSKFPNGGWARIDSIKMGKWKPWHPRPVLIPAESFMEKDQEKQSHWITLAPGMAIQGLLAERDGKQRVYVVTEETPPEYHWIHDRWSRLRKIAMHLLSHIPASRSAPLECENTYWKNC